MAADLSRVMASVPEPTVALRLRILADAHAGRLYMTPSLDVSHVPLSERSAYLGAFRGMCRDAWLMETPPVGDGHRRVVLTSIGEFVHRHANTDRYRSRYAFEVRDGQVSAAAVAP